MSDSLSETLRKHLSHTVVNYVSESAIDSSGVWATEAEIPATANLKHDISLYMQRVGILWNGLRILHLLH